VRCLGHLLKGFIEIEIVAVNMLLFCRVGISVCSVFCVDCFSLAFLSNMPRRAIAMLIAQLQAL
jgi:hypothetical protein